MLVGAGECIVLVVAMWQLQLQLMKKAIRLVLSEAKRDAKQKQAPGLACLDPSSSPYARPFPPSSVTLSVCRLASSHRCSAVFGYRLSKIADVDAGRQTSQGNSLQMDL